MIEDFEKFKNREIKAKDIFSIAPISKNEAYNFVKMYHYLKDLKFLSIFSYGLFYKNDIVGVSTFSSPQGSVTLKGWFGLPNTDKTILELSRLCVFPQLNKTNATSFLLSNSIKFLKKEGIRAVITLADASRHVGSIYQVCNFKYYGLADRKRDFYRNDGIIIRHGKVSNEHGVWIERTRKHRYAMILDKKLKCLYKELPYPKITDLEKYEVCQSCLGTGKLYNKRYNEWYTCPSCGDFHLIE